MFFRFKEVLAKNTILYWQSSKSDLQQNLQHHADGQKNGNGIGQHKGASDLPPAQSCHGKHSLLFSVSCCHLWPRSVLQADEEGKQAELGPSAGPWWMGLGMSGVGL